MKPRVLLPCHGNVPGDGPDMTDPAPLGAQPDIRPFDAGGNRDAGGRA